MQTGKFKLKLIAIGTILSLLTACATPNQDLYQSAKQNFKAKKYSLAYRQLQQPARAGNPDAQYALGYLYYYGKGTMPNKQKAIYWFNKAANQGQKQAKVALREMGN